MTASGDTPVTDRDGVEILAPHECWALLRSAEVGRLAVSIMRLKSRESAPTFGAIDMNTKAALITRGLAELSRLGVAAGGSPLTFSGLAGNGDLIATCSSPQSRNHRVGQQLAAGRRLRDILADSTSVAEGVETAPAVVGLSQRLGVAMPICETVDAMLADRLAPSAALLTLMRREPKGELDGLPTITP